MIRRLLLPALALLLVACTAKPEPKRYSIHGVVKLLDPAAKTATIQHQKIGDWMEAMTMEFPVKPDAEFQKLHVGDTIDGTVVVDDVKYYVTDIRIAAAAGSSPAEH